MAIMKMKRLSFHAPISQRDELLHELQLLGCVEISQPETVEDESGVAGGYVKAPAGAFERKTEHNMLIRSIELLDKYSPKKNGLLTPRPMVAPGVIFEEGSLSGALELAQEIDGLESAIKSIDAQLSQNRATTESLVPWLDLKVPLNLTETDSCYVMTGVLQGSVSLDELSAALEEAECESAVYEVSAEKSARYVLLIVMKDKRPAAMEALRAFGFSQSSLAELKGTAQDNFERLSYEKLLLEQEKEAKIEEICSHADKRDELKLCADRMMTKLASAENAEKLLYSERTFTFEGWVTEETEPQLSKVLSRYDVAWETSVPPEEDYPEVPIKLKNGKISSGLNMVTEMYSLPAYGSLDPNPLMAPFFIFFYGLMMADMGYGILMIIAGLLVSKKRRPRTTMGYMFNLMIWCGITTFAFGVATAGFFGDFVEKLLLMINPESTFVWFWPALFSPVEDAMSVLVGCLALGLVQIFVGMGVSMYKQIKRGQLMAALCNEGAWYVVFILLGVAALTGMWSQMLIAILVLLVLTQGYGKKGIGGKLLGIGGSLYNNITGYFSDILSYSRLMALMLAGAVIAQVFNTLGMVTGNVVGYVLIATIGNGLNFALNLLSCFVHDMRLQCLEYFGRFYEDGGKAFKPLKITTDYYDVITEQGGK